MSYKNAAEILPEELLCEIRKYFPGGILWVPGIEAERKERDELVVFLKNNGVLTKEISRLAKLTPRHIRRIVEKNDSAGRGRT